MAFSKDNKLIAGDFRANLDKKTLIRFNLQADGTENGLSNIKILQKGCSCECFSYTKVYAYSRLVSQVYMMAGQNVKKKYLMCQIQIKMLKENEISN